jgi:hypothetical protein
MAPASCSSPIWLPPPVPHQYGSGLLFHINMTAASCSSPVGLPHHYTYEREKRKNEGTTFSSDNLVASGKRETKRILSSSNFSRNRQYHPGSENSHTVTVRQETHDNGSKRKVRFDTSSIAWCWSDRTPNVHSEGKRFEMGLHWRIYFVAFIPLYGLMPRQTRSQVLAYSPFITTSSCVSTAHKHRNRVVR